MKTKSFILGGVAAAALIGITPATAFTHHPGTPAEHRQTEDLNQQQLNQAQQATPSSQQMAQSGTANGQQPVPGAMSNTQQANAGATAETSTAANPEMQASAAPMAAPTGTVSQTTASATPVESIANPPQTLANASVESSSGQAVGAVQKVITDASGKAKTVIVALLGKVNKMVAIAANQLNFDQSRNVVVAQMSSDQINSLPAAPQG
jgi:hypothetical protein